MKLQPARKVLFLFLIILAAGLIVGFDDAQGAEDLVVAVDKSTLVKGLGLIFVAFCGAMWRKLDGFGEELKELKGFCKGKNSDCGEEN